jgi:hypothetical protein
MVAELAGTVDMDDKALYLMLALPEHINTMNISVIKNIMKRGCTPVVVSVNMPYIVLARVYAKKGIDPQQLYVVDAVTHYSGGATEPNPHVRYISSPANLTDMGIAITDMLTKIPEPDKCIVFDSVSMLLIHSPTVTASKFLHFVVNKLKILNVSGIFLCVDKGLDPVVLSQMSAFVDKILDFETGEKPDKPDTSKTG